MRYSVEYGDDPDMIDAMIESAHRSKYHRCRCTSTSIEPCDWCDGSHDECETEDDE